MSIAENLAAVQDEIAAACAAAGRRPEEITLIAVTKTVSASVVREAYAAGVRRVGENRVQELLAKQPDLEDLDLEWHMIGSLQTNKAKAVVPRVALIHSLDRLELAQKIDRLAAGGPPVAGLIQVNTSAEASKSGVEPKELDALLDAIRPLPGIRVHGLMTIGPLAGDESSIRRSFALLRELRESARRRNPDLELPVLSMGMSGDFPLAILEGATHVRIGSRLFGERD